MDGQTDGQRDGQRDGWMSGMELNTYFLAIIRSPKLCPVSL